jgi:hypothetical protein
MTTNKTDLTDADRDRIARAIEARREEMTTVAWDLMNDSVGVLHAESDLRKSLDKVLERLKADDYHAVSQLGYSEVASAFIFLQRVMGGMQMNAYRRVSVISDVAGDAKLTYEQVEPFAEAAFNEARENIGKKKDTGE